MASKIPSLAPAVQDISSHWTPVRLLLRRNYRGQPTGKMGHDWPVRRSWVHVRNSPNSDELDGRFVPQRSTSRRAGQMQTARDATIDGLGR